MLKETWISLVFFVVVVAGLAIVVNGCGNVRVACPVVDVGSVIGLHCTLDMTGISNPFAEATPTPPTITSRP